MASVFEFLDCLSVCSLFWANFLTFYTKVQYSIVQYSTVQYSTVRYSTVQYSTLLYLIEIFIGRTAAALYYTVQYCTVLYCTVMPGGVNLLYYNWQGPALRARSGALTK